MLSGALAARTGRVIRMPVKVGTPGTGLHRGRQRKEKKFNTEAQRARSGTERGSGVRRNGGLASARGWQTDRLDPALLPSAAIRDAS